MNAQRPNFLSIPSAANPSNWVVGCCSSQSNMSHSVPIQSIAETPSAHGDVFRNQDEGVTYSAA